MRRIRLRAEETFAQGFSRLTEKQQTRTAAVRAARDSVAEYQSALDAERAVLLVEVESAVSSGVPVRMLADLLGVSSSRVYQMLDELAEARQEYATSVT